MNKIITCLRKSPWIIGIDRKQQLFKIILIQEKSENTRWKSEKRAFENFRLYYFSI